MVPPKDRIAPIFINVSILMKIFIFYFMYD